MKKASFLIVLILCLTTSIPVLAAERPTYQSNGDIVIMTADTGTINASNVRLRLEPSLYGKILTTLKKGTEVGVGSDTVEADEYTWRAVIVVSTGQFGWVADKYITVEPV